MLVACIFKVSAWGYILFHSIFSLGFWIWEEFISQDYSHVTLSFHILLIFEILLYFQKSFFFLSF